MNIACCFQDPGRLAGAAAQLALQGLQCERFQHESALLRALRHRGAIDLAVIETRSDAMAGEDPPSWLDGRLADGVPLVLVCTGWPAARVARALDAGADDCIAQSFDAIELVARIKAVLRRGRAAHGGQQQVELAGFVLDRSAGTLLDRGAPVPLTRREFALAWLFFTNPGVRLAREAIGLAIWGAAEHIASRTLEQHIYKLRKKLRLGAARGVALSTAYGQGYCLAEHGGAAE